MHSSSHDLVLYGATSFVGQIIASHLTTRLAGSDVTWAMAGRSLPKLEQVRADLGPAGADIELLVADAQDADALSAMLSDTRVVLSTVGPYAQYGSTLIRLCAEQGVDYCDLTGEVQWVAEMIREHHDTAVASGARIVPSAGFDSIPSDMGVHVLQQEAVRKLGSVCTAVHMRVRGMKGGASGGTIASMMNIAAEVASDADLRRVLADPYALCPEEGRPTTRQPDVNVPQHDGASGAWIAPFIMAGINTRVVHRSHALSGHPWGTGFTYDEAMHMGSGPLGAAKAAGLSGGLAAFFAGAALPPTRWLLGKLLPAPGEGPSPEAQAAGYFRLRFIGTTEQGGRIELDVTGDADPGYGSTAKMITEVALSLLEDLPTGDGAPSGGFWTTSSLLGDALVDRLTKHAGLEFTVRS